MELGWALPTLGEPMMTTFLFRLVDILGRSYSVSISSESGPSDEIDAKVRRRSLDLMRDAIRASHGSTGKLGR